MPRFVTVKLPDFSPGGDAFRYINIDAVTSVLYVPPEPPLKGCEHLGPEPAKIYISQAGVTNPIILNASDAGPFLDAIGVTSQPSTNFRLSRSREPELSQT